MIQPIDFVRLFLIPHEGTAFENVPGDTGNIGDDLTPGNFGTKFGIDAASHPGIDIAALTQAQAEAIYLDEFSAVAWQVGAGQPFALNDFPYPAALVFFDARENCGLTASWKCLQRALSLTDDGIPGPVTKAAVIKAPGLTLAMSQIDERIAYYRQIAAANPNDRQFLQGWENRCADLKAFQFFPA